MLNQGLGSWIHKRRIKSKDRTAIINGDTSLSYAELAVRVDKLANALRDLGVLRVHASPTWETTTPHSWKPFLPAAALVPFSFHSTPGWPRAS